jgi:hypothetical protein
MSDKEKAEEKPPVVYKLAKDAVADKIFFDFQLKDVTMLRMVFMPLGFLDDKGLENMRTWKPVRIFEYIDKAGPRAINGYPSFFSMQFLNQEEWDVVAEYIKKFQTALDSV